MRILLAAVLLSAFALAGCSDGGSRDDGNDDASGGSPTPSPTVPDPAPAPITHQSVMRSNLFEPADLTINVGDTVHWITEDVQAHNVVSESEAASFRSPDVSTVPVPPGRETEYSYTFEVAGTVDYLCEYHSGMVGTITVVDPSSS